MNPPERLTPLEERDLVIATEAGDAEACRQLIETFLPAINGVARRFRGAVGIERQELVQEGVAALLFAARRYDPQLETPFWAYAAFWVRKAMQELVADLSRAVVLSDRAVRGLAAVRAVRSERLQVDGREPTLDELAAATGLTRDQVAQLLAADRPAASLHARVDSEDESAGTMADRIADPAASEAFDVVLDTIEVRQVQALADRLSEREVSVIRAHFGLEGAALTLSQIGGSLGLSAERARQIEAGALGKLRTLLAQPALQVPVQDFP